VVALKASAPLVNRLSPEMRSPASLSANGKAFRPWNMAGVWPVALEMNEHEIAYGRMFNELDDEMARSVCVIGTATRDELWGAPEKVGREIIPVGETLFINHVPFTIIGMFKHYESEQERKAREYALAHPVEPDKGAVKRDRGRGGGRKRGNNFVFYLKNATVYIPLNTMWMKFRAGAVFTGYNSAPPAPRRRPRPRSAPVFARTKNCKRRCAARALQQIRNVLMCTHKGIEDFSFRTQEDWAEQINTFIRNARLSGGLIAASVCSWRNRDHEHHARQHL